MTPPAFFNKIAKHYDLLTHLYMFGTYNAVRRRILSLHRDENTEVLDICCGTGYISNSISADRVVGIDLSLPMLRVNQRNQEQSIGDTYLINGDIRSLPIKNAQFDEVYFTLAAHEFPNLPDELRELKRVMKPGGRLVIYDLYNPRNPFLRLFLNTFFYYVVEQRVMHTYTLEGWEMLLDEIGFRKDRLEVHYGLSALVSAVK